MRPALALVGLLVAACGLLPGFGIGRDEAIRVALEDTQLTSPVVVDVREGDLENDQPTHVWIVTVRGGWDPCEQPYPGMGQQPCGMQQAQDVVFIDYETGTHLRTQIKRGGLGAPVFGVPGSTVEP